MNLTSKFLENYYFEIFNCTFELRFEYTDINEIEPDAFKYCRKRKLILVHFQKSHDQKDVKLISLNKEHLSLFEPLKEHLKDLNLSCNFKCEFNFLEHLRNLKWLSLSRSVFSTGRPVFKGANNCLTYLYLDNCELKISDKTMFNDLKCLTHLDLTQVELDDQVLPDLFKELKQLKSLTMFRTKFKPAENAFIHLENLIDLFFMGIEIPNECSNIFAPLKRLQKLAMGFTKTLNYEAFRRVKNLRELRLSDFSTIEIDANFFDQHPNLESLDLSHLNSFDPKSVTNEKCCIDLRALANLTSLKSLNLSNNNFNIDADCEAIFNCLEKLETLNLSLDKRYKFIFRLVKLNETTLERMKHLKVLNLSGNLIKIEGNCFQHLTQLKELDLSEKILRSDNNEVIFSSLKQLEKFKFDGIEPCESFQLHRLSELANLRELELEMTHHDLEQYGQMLRVERGPAADEDEQTNPTYDDLCYFILRDMTKLTKLNLYACKI